MDGRQVEKGDGHLLLVMGPSYDGLNLPSVNALDRESRRARV